MEIPLRVLIVEDSEDDALMVIRTLKKGGYNPAVERVETADAMRTALRETSWDIVLSDYKMPSFSGLAALNVLKEAAIDIPFIIVSGAIGEEIAADAMRTGAHDYIMKGNLSRLVPAITRELRETQKRWEQKKAEGRQALVAQILNILNNQADVAHLTRHILLLIKDYTGIEAIGIRLKEGDDYPYHETKGFTPDFLATEQSLCDRDADGEIIRDSKGHPYLACMCGNVIEGRTDHALSFFTERGSFWTNNTTQFLVSATEHKYHAHMRSRCLMEGYESLALIPLRSDETIIGLLQLNDRRPDCFTEDMIHFLEEIGASIGIAINRQYTLAFLQSSAEALQKREYLLNETQKLSKVGGWEYDIDSRTMTWTEETYHICDVSHDYDPSNVNKNLELYTPEHKQILKQAFSRAIKRGDSYDLELRFSSAQGNAKWVRTTCKPLWVDGMLKKVSGYLMDISESKQLEESLLQAEEKYRNIVENAIEGIFQTEIDGRYITTNLSSAITLGYDSAAELMSVNFQQLFVNRDDLLKIRSILSSEGIVRGFETQFYRKDGTAIWVSLNSRVVRDPAGNIKYTEGYSENITERKESIERIRKALGAIIQAMAITVEVRDPYTAGHQRRVADLARGIATELHLPPDQIDGIRMAASIHDIGKISIPAEILSRPTKLTEIEFGLIKVHPQAGYEILKDIDFPWPIARIILEHHERMNGSGYPMGLKGEKILLESKIVMVADVIEAIASYRPYRPALGIEVALDEIKNNKGVLYDAAVADACAALFECGGYQLG
jgi:PAS domain S-box-containing protein